MFFSFTGMAYLFGFLAISLLSYRLFQYEQREKTLVSKCFFYFSALFNLFFFITAMGALFFAGNSLVLKGVVISAVFFQGLACAILGYLVFYMIFPHFSPWIGFVIISILSAVSIIFSLITPFSPLLESSGNLKVINWGAQPLADIFRFSFFFFTFFPMMIIFFRQGVVVKDPELKTKALGLGMVFFLGLASTVLDFILNNYFNVGAISNNIAILFLAVSTFLTVIFTQKPPPPLYVKKIQ